MYMILLIAWYELHVCSLQFFTVFSYNFKVVKADKHKIAKCYKLSKILKMFLTDSKSLILNFFDNISSQNIIKENWVRGAT